jgi:hypothetical protein
MTTKLLQRRVQDVMRAGASLEQVDAQIGSRSELDDENQAAMWLSANAVQEPGRQRYAARRAATAMRARDATPTVGTD